MSIIDMLLIGFWFFLMSIYMLLRKERFMFALLCGISVITILYVVILGIRNPNMFATNENILAAEENIITGIYCIVAIIDAVIFIARILKRELLLLFGVSFWRSSIVR